MFAVSKNPVLPTDIGLKYRPSLGTERDKADWLQVVELNGVPTNVNYLHQKIHPEFSTGNKYVLLSALGELQGEGRLKSILEIGVFRSKDESSTKCILDHKPLETKYFGIDLAEHNLVPIRDHDKNIFCLAENSSNIDTIMPWCGTHGTTEFDLILIDGYHSVDQVLDDWRFIKYLAPGGTVLFHDTNYHPGPFCVFDAIDEAMFEKAKFCNDVEADWGVATARKK